MDLKAADSAILGAWAAGVAAGFMSLLKSVFSIAGSGLEWQGIIILGLADAIIIFALTYGIYKKRSRACAVSLLSYFLIGNLAIWIQSRRPIGLIFVVFLSYFFFQGIRGTFAYQKIMQAKEAASIAQS